MLGVVSILNAQPDMIVTATASTVDELLALGDALDGVLLDLKLADDSTPTANIDRISTLGIPILVYTSGDRPALIREAAGAGAAGMIRKSELPSEIVTAVRSMLGGEVVASADWAAALDVDPEFTRVHLTPREAEVLGHYASGETADRVAKLLFISRETVLDHIRHIRIKYAEAGRRAPTKVSLHQRAVEDGVISWTDNAVF